MVINLFSICLFCIGTKMNYFENILSGKLTSSLLILLYSQVTIENNKYLYVDTYFDQLQQLYNLISIIDISMCVVCNIRTYSMLIYIAKCLYIL